MGVNYSQQNGINGTVAQWGSRIHNMGIDLLQEARARTEKINPHAIGGTILVAEFIKVSFVAGLRDDRIKSIDKAREEEDSIAQLVETALQEESEVKSQKFKGNQRNMSWLNTRNSGN